MSDPIRAPRCCDSPMEQMGESDAYRCPFCVKVLTPVKWEKLHPLVHLDRQLKSLVSES